MREDAHSLKFATKETLSKFTHAFQLENGKIFYIKIYLRELYVRIDNDEIEAKLPEGFGEDELTRAAVHENSLYFESNRRIYKIAFTDPDILRLSYVREQLEGEHFFRYAMCARSLGSLPFLYRLCDHPNKDGIIQDLRPEEKDGLVAISIHRKKLIYIMQNQENLPMEVQQKNANAVSILLPHSASYEASFSQDSSQFFYIANRDSLFTINTDTLEILPELHLNGISFRYIVGVYNGVITLLDNEKKWKLLSAQLPEGYFDKPICDTINGGKPVTKSRIKLFFGNLFKRSPPPAITEDLDESADIDNNSNVIQPNVKGTPMLDKMAAPMYLAFKSSFKMTDNIDPEKLEFASKFFNEFTIIQIIGNGNSGCLFEVDNKQDKCKYAVRRIPVAADNLDEMQAEMFALVQLEHPGFVKYQGIWIEKPPKGWQLRADFKMLEELESSRNFRDDDAFVYIQMELYKQSLAQWLKDNQTALSRSQSRVKTWFKQIVSAVWYLHDNNIIHCDIRPKNILIDSSDRLKLCVLGIAMERKIGFEDDASLSRHSICSPLYMSPEQSFQTHPRCSFKTNIFALGLILAELCLVIKNDEERYEIFDSYREGEPKNNLFEDEDTAELVSWLAEKNSRNRPTAFMLRKIKDEEVALARAFKSEFQSKFVPIKLLALDLYFCVFEVENKLDNWRYAVKRITVDWMGDYWDADSEVKSIASLTNEGIQRYYHSWREKPPTGWQTQHDLKMLTDMGEDPSNFFRTLNAKESAFLYIQFELCQPSLFGWLSENEHRDLQRMKNWFKQIVSAVAYIHGQGKIHSDLRTKNVFFAGDDCLKVGGLTFVQDRHIIDTDEGRKEFVKKRVWNKYTMAYFDIERMETDSLSYSSKSDIFCLGVMLAELWNNGTTLLDHLPEVKEFVKWMTNEKEDERPTCSEILAHDWFRDTVMESVMESIDVADAYASQFSNQFTVKGILGVGGFGCVFEAMHKHDQIVYAVKRIAEKPAEVEKGLEEVRKMAALHHDGIVQYNYSWIEKPPVGWQHDSDYNLLKELKWTKRTLVDFDDCSVFIYIQMKLYKKSLAKWLENNQDASSRSLSRIKEWLKQTVEAMQYLHERNIIHSDIKPENILLDENDRVKICDLGIANERQIENGLELTVTRSGFRSPLYMSPEQSAYFTRYSSKTDIFSMGLVLAELCIVIKTLEDKFKIFESYRQGEPQNSLFADSETADFVAWLAAKDSRDRPTCAQILTHTFIKLD